jgi:hypothetical protein
MGVRKRRHPARCRLQIEKLEDRNLLSFQVLGTLGTRVALPTGTAFRINDFEPNGLNNRGDVLYGDDLGTANDPSTFFGEGIFLRSHGQETVLANSTAPAPGGGTFDFSFLGPSALNSQGDAAFDFLLQPAGAPFGVNAGAYRYSHSTGTVTPVVVPGVTPAPAGGTFAGVSFTPTLNNRGDLIFPGIVTTDQGIHVPGQAYIGLGQGLFKPNRDGTIASVLSPGDPAPGGGKFDWAAGPAINSGGDIAFEGHVAGEEAQDPNFPPQAALIAALGSVYVKDGATGQVQSIAHAGNPAPGGGVFRQAVFPHINDRGDVLFTGDLTPAPAADQVLGVFLSSGGKIIPIARPGDPMPGGGHLVTVSVVGGNTNLNNPGDVVFNAALDTSHNGVPDTGLFEWSHGRLSLIARSGTVLPGVGTVSNLTFNVIVTPPPPIVVPNSGAVINDRGQVLFGATLTDGRSVMLLYTPTAGGASGSALLEAPAAPGRLLAVVGPGTGATSRPAPTMGRGRLPDAALATLVGSTVVPPAVGQSAARTVRFASRVEQSPAPVADRDGATLPAPSAHLVTGLTGALHQRAVGAFFARQGSSPWADPLGNSPF